MQLRVVSACHGCFLMLCVQICCVISGARADAGCSPVRKVLLSLASGTITAMMSMPDTQASLQRARQKDGKGLRTRSALVPWSRRAGVLR